jgi:hypothetical protein
VCTLLSTASSFREVADGEVVLETPAPFAALPVALASSVSFGGGLVCRCICRQLIGGDVFKVLNLSHP